MQACQKKGGTVDIETSEEAGFVQVIVNDSGLGLPESESGDIFEPYVTTKLDGVGLGLTIVKENLRSMQGTIEATNRPEGGAQFTVRMPKAEKE
jgi:two-component system C4-dicarboxylate transport sensor histidine kinase DctB